MVGSCGAHGPEALGDRKGRGEGRAVMTTRGVGGGEILSIQGSEGMAT